MMIRSLNDCGGYDESDFCKRLDEELFPQLDGTPISAPGRYTSQSIREVWRQRIIEGKSWQDTGDNTDTTEAIERTLAIGIRYATRPTELAAAIANNTVLTHGQNQVRAILTGSLVGAQVGLSQIPERFIQGLENNSELLDLARVLACQVPAAQ